MVPVWLSVCAMVVAVGYLFTLSSNARVSVVADPGSLHREVSTYSAFIDKQLGSSLLNYSKLSINTLKLEDQIYKEFPEIQNVTVAIPLFAHRPLIELTSVEPVFMLSSGTNSKYYINPQGVALLSVDSIQAPEKSLLTVIDQSTISLEQGMRVLPRDLVNYIVELQRQFDAKEYTTAQTVLPPTPNELQVRFEGRPYVVRFNTSIDPVEQAGTYMALFEDLESKNIVPAEYIDLRVAGRAYYK